MEDIKKVAGNIVKDNDTVLEIPLSDLVWTIVVFSYNMSTIEDEIFSEVHNTINRDNLDKLVMRKECTAARRDELARIIGQYSDFDTRKIWDEVDNLFKHYEV